MGTKIVKHMIQNTSIFGCLYDSKTMPWFDVELLPT